MKTRRLCEREPHARGGAHHAELDARPRHRQPTGVDTAITDAVDSGDHSFAEVMRAATVVGLLTEAELRARLRRAAGGVSVHVGGE